MGRKSKKPEKPNDLLRYERERRGLTQSRLAELIGADPSMVSRWERGARRTDLFYQEKLCQLFEKDAVELGFIESTSSKVSSMIENGEDQQRAETQNVERDDMDKNRRLTLQILGLTGTSLVVGSSQVEALLARKLARLQTWVLDSLEDGTRLRWQLYYMSNNSLTEEGLRSQIAKLEQLADEGGKEHRRISLILAQNYQLAGSLARDKFQYSTARSLFTKAQDIAIEESLPDMEATAIARHGLALLRQEHVEESLEFYRGAASVAERAEPLTKAYVFSGLAEALARNGYRDECYSALDQAEWLLDHAQSFPPEEDFAFIRLTMQSLQDSRGECHVLLGEPLKGLEYLQTAQKHLDHKMSRNYCRLLMQQSEAYLVAGIPDQCVDYALKGLQIARSIESTSNINWSREIHTKLLSSPWKKEAVVGKLETALRSR